jgi:hypothetical protein
MRSSFRRSLHAAVVIALAAAGTAATAVPAVGHVAPKPRTYTAVMTPTSARPGVVTSYTVAVKNTSKVLLTALDHFVLTVPTGFSVTAGTVKSPRGGWTESVAGGLLSASTSVPLRYGLHKGESMKVKFTATDDVSCDARKVTWAQKADGAIIDPYIAQSPDPQVQMTPVADNFAVTTVTDASNPPLTNAVAVGAPFTVSGIFRCGEVATPTWGPSTLSLVKSAPGSPDNGGVIGGTTSVSVPAYSSAATVSGATYSAIENQVGITAAWSGGAGDSFALNVFGEVVTVNGTPGEAIEPEQLNVTGAAADLPNGANGPVSIVVSACGADQTQTAPCSSGTQIELTGNFKDDGSDPLYSFDAPAEISWLCAAETCPHGTDGSVEDEPSTDYTYNYECPGSSCDGNGSDFGEREVEEDFTAYPVYVSIHKDGADTPFAIAPRCVPLPESNYDPEKSTLLHTTGQIIDPAAQALGFCVDVNAITRTDNSFTGDLRIPVLFVEDLKLRP